MAVVGLEQTIFTVTEEDVGFVELCIDVSSPLIECPVQFPFKVQLSTLDETSGKHQQLR